MERKVTTYEIEEFDDIEKYVTLHSDILNVSVSYNTKSKHYVVEIIERFKFR